MEITVPASYNDEQTAAAIVRVLNQAPQIGDNSVWRSFNHDWLRTVKAIESSEAYQQAQANLLAGSATTVAAGARVEVAIMSALSVGGGVAELVVRASEGDVSAWDLPALLPILSQASKLRTVVVAQKGKITRFRADDIREAVALRQSLSELDAVRRGTQVQLNGWVATRRQLQAATEELRRYGVTVVRDADDYLDGNYGVNVAAGYNNQTRTMYLRRNATWYEVFHELTHARHHQALGDARYRALTPFERELYVFRQIMHRAKEFEFTSEEINSATDYIRRVAAEHGRTVPGLD